MLYLINHELRPWQGPKIQKKCVLKNVLILIELSVKSYPNNGQKIRQSKKNVLHTGPFRTNLVRPNSQELKILEI